MEPDMRTLLNRGAGEDKRVDDPKPKAKVDHLHPLRLTKKAKLKARKKTKAAKKARKKQRQRGVTFIEMLFLFCIIAFATVTFVALGSVQ